MNEIARKMMAKGYTPLASDGLGGIGFTPRVGAQVERLAEPMWFETGLKMKDGTPRTVAAHDNVQASEYIAKGWKPVNTTVKKVEMPKATTKRRTRKK